MKLGAAANVEQELRSKALDYAEITLVRLIFFFMAGVLGMLGSWLWRLVAGNQVIQRELVLIFTVVFILPCRILAAVVWDIKVAFLGAKAERESERAEGANRFIE